MISLRMTNCRIGESSSCVLPLKKLINKHITKLPPVISWEEVYTIDLKSTI